MQEIFSTVRGPTDAAAATETRLGGDDIEIPTRKPYFTLIGLQPNWAAIVDDLSAAGIIELKISGVNGPFRWVIGNGAGGATNVALPLPDYIPINIPVPGGAKVGIYVTFPNAVKDIICELEYIEGKIGKPTYSDCPALTAAANADTRTGLGSITLLPGQWVLETLRFVGGNVVDAKARSGKLELTGGSIIAAEHILGVGDGPGASASQSKGPAEVKRLNIPHSGSVSLGVYATMAEAYLHLGYSIQYS